MVHPAELMERAAGVLPGEVVSPKTHSWLGTCRASLSPESSPGRLPTGPVGLCLPSGMRKAFESQNHFTDTHITLVW